MRDTPAGVGTAPPASEPQISSGAVGGRASSRCGRQAPRGYAPRARLESGRSSSDAGVETAGDQETPEARRPRGLARDQRPKAGVVTGHPQLGQLRRSRSRAPNRFADEGLGRNAAGPVSGVPTAQTPTRMVAQWMDAGGRKVVIGRPSEAAGQIDRSWRRALPSGDTSSSTHDSRRRRSAGGNRQAKDPAHLAGLHRLAPRALRKRLPPSPSRTVARSRGSRDGRTEQIQVVKKKTDTRLYVPKEPAPK